MSSMGIAVYGNGGMNTEYKGGTAEFNCAAGGGPNAPCSSPGTFGAGTAGVNLMQLFVNGSYSRKLDDKNAVGASLIFAYQRFMAYGLDFFSPVFQTDPSKLSGNRKSDSSGFGFKLGYQGEVAPGIRLGASYQSKMSMSKFSEYQGLFANGGSFDIPSTYTVGTEFDAGPTGKVVADVQKINYSEVDSIANPVSNLTDNVSARSHGWNGSRMSGWF